MVAEPAARAVRSVPLWRQFEGDVAGGERHTGISEAGRRVDKNEQWVRKTVHIRHRGKRPGEDTGYKQWCAYPEYRLVAEVVGNVAPVGDRDVSGKLAQGCQCDYL
jgi:hypothetical protein